MYEIKPNRTYRIQEYVNQATPDGLKNIGRSKMGGGFHELVGCLYDSRTERYDTGLDKTSREFFGKSEKEVEKTLKDRKELVEHFEYVKAGRTNEEFLPSYTLEVYHGLLLDTSSRDVFLRLWFAMRNNLIAPQKDTGNRGKYSTASYVLIDNESEKDAKTKFKEQEYDILAWLTKTWDENSEEVLEYLKYTGILDLGAKKTSKVGVYETVSMTIKNREKLEELSKATKEVAYNDVKIFNQIKKIIRAGEIQKVGQMYVFENIELGVDAHAIAKFLTLKANREIATKIFKEE